MATAKKAAPPVIGAPLEQTVPTVEQVTSLAIQSYGVTDATIAELKNDYGKLTIAGVEDKETYNTANAAIGRIRSMRTNVEAKRKEIKEPFLRAGQAIDAEAKRLTAELLPIEEHLKGQVKAIDEEAERRRKAEEIRRVNLLTSSGFTLLGQTYVAVNVVVHWDDVTRLTEDQLQQTVARGIAALEEQRAEQERQRQAALEAERKAKELADLEAQLAAKRAELAAMQQPQPTAPVDIQVQAAQRNEWEGLPGMVTGTQPAATHYGDPRNWDSNNVYPQNNLPRYDNPPPPPPPANFTEYRQQNGFASQNEPATAPPIGTPAPAKSVYFMDGWEACKARIIKTFIEDATPRKRAEWVEIFQNLKP